MDPKPFTYEHFIQAVQSLKDDMLMYYIDEAVGMKKKKSSRSLPAAPRESTSWAGTFMQMRTA